MESGIKLLKSGEAMIVFIGTYNHTMDAKNRVIVPSKYREELGDEFVLTLGLDKCLNAYPLSAWDVVVEQLDRLPGTPEARTLQRFILNAATPCEIDKQGRILIPSKHKEYAGLKKDIVFAGASKKVEIWDKERHDALSLNYEAMDKVADMIATFNISF